MHKIGKVGWWALVVLILAGLISLATGKVATAEVQGGWRGEYYNNMTLSGSPAVVRVDKAIDFNWGGSPASGVSADNFSVRWTGNLNVSSGRYRFVMATDDGGRLWVNGQLVIDKWFDQQGQHHEVTIDLPNGTAYVQMEYYENVGGAKAFLDYMRTGGSSGGGGPWNAKYYNNKNLSGEPSLTRNEADINFNWGSGSPAPGTINADNFSAKWTRQLELAPGRYQFAATTDDGVRLWVNNQLIIDQWRDQNPTTYRAEIDLPGGSVPVKMEYYENTGGAKAQLSWALVTGGGTPPGGVPVPGPWRAEYFNNTGLSGSPVLVRDEGQPNSSWGYGSPAPGVVGNDFFSARWTRTLEFIPGRYRFTATTDDGVRLWVNNQLIINNWRNQAAQPSFGEIDLAGGLATVRMEYYEADVLAEARLGWTRMGAAPNTGGGPTAIVTSYSLNVRQGPGMAYAIISQLSRGQLVQLAGIRNADATWVKVILPDGRQGWSYAGYLQSSVPFSGFVVDSGQPAPGGGPATSNTATVTAYYLNVRQGPGVGYGVITAVPRNTLLQLTGRNTAATWARVTLSSGTQGWVNASYLNSATPVSSLPIVG
jgi:uncharacterized protein YgiM (DUF1202 family)